MKHRLSLEISTVTVRVIITILVLNLSVFVISCGEKPADEEGVDGIDHYNRGIALMEQGDYKNAIIELEAAIRANPEFFEAEKNLAGAFAADGRWNDALAHYLKARELQPDDPSIYTNLAVVYHNLGNPELAWKYLRTSLEKDPNYPLAHYVAGEMFVARGDLEGAVNAFNDYLKLESGTRYSTEAEKFISEIESGEFSGRPGLIGSPGQSNLDSGLPESGGLEGENDSGILPEEDDMDIEEFAEDEEVAEEEGEVDEEAGEEEPVVEEESADDEESVSEEDTEEDTTEQPAEDEADTTEEDETELDESGDDGEEVEAEEGEAGDDEEESDEDTEGEDDDSGEVVEPELPDLEGDDLYQDRLRRGRRARATGDYDFAIKVLLEAYDVHPDYAQVNYELALSLIGKGNISQGKYYLEKYIELEPDPSLKANARAKLEEIEGGESDGEDESGTAGEEGTSSDEDEEQENGDDDGQMSWF